MNMLLMVDVQPSFANETNAEKIKDFVKAHKDEYSEIYSTVFQNTQESMFVKMLEWNECMEEEFPFVKGDVMLTKHTYGLSPKHIESFKNKGATIDIVGGDLDACVLAVAFQLFDNGIDFRILTDYCFSSAGVPYYYAALKVAKHCFGTAVVEEADMKNSEDVQENDTVSSDDVNPDKDDANVKAEKEIDNNESEKNRDHKLNKKKKLRHRSLRMMSNSKEKPEEDVI